MSAALSEFDRLVGLMLERKIPRHMAEAAARRELGITPKSALEQIRDEADANAGEKDEQAECIRIYRAHNCAVYSTSQYRPAKISAGLADLLVFCLRAKTFWFHEVKRAKGGVQSPAQADFQMFCDGCEVRYVIGDRTAAWATLRKIGVTDEQG